jgi:alkylation response protein AidB-like acyl-CoA dehydrogenase
VHDVVLDLEDAFAGIAQDDIWRKSLQDEAKAAGVFGPRLPVEFGGHGLGLVERAPSARIPRTVLAHAAS